MTRTSLILTIGVVAACGGRPDAAPPAAPKTLALADSVDHLDALAREPMVVQHPGGALFVTGYWDPMPRLWKSSDLGATWNAVTVGTAKDGAAGNSDVDLAVAPDGTLYFVTMVFDRARLEGASVHVAVSHDTGSTWAWTELSRTRFDDRPWVEAAPDGTAHVIWNDGAGVSHAMSTDAGRTWTEQGRPSMLGGSSHLAVGPKGELAVRLVPLSASGNRFTAGVDSLVVSADRGATWTRYPAPGRREWHPMVDTTTKPAQWSVAEQPHWVEPLAWDDTGALYSFWADGRSLWLARSVDRGAQWTSWKVADAEATPYYPYLIARGHGDLAASWFSGKGDSLRAHVARFRVPADSGAPAVVIAPAFTIESLALAFFPNQKVEPDPAGEYLALAFLKDGSLGLVAPLQHMAAKRLGFTWRRYVERP